MVFISGQAKGDAKKDSSLNGSPRRKIKVLHVTFNMAIGGTEQVIRQLVLAATSLGVVCEILCIDGEVGAIGKALQEQGISIATVKRTPGFDRNLIGMIRTYVRKNEIDVVHCHQYTPYLYGFLGALGTRAKVVFTEHGRFHPDRYRYKAMLVTPVIALLTPAIVAISSATRDALARYEFIPKWKIKVIYNGIQGLRSDSERKISLRESLGIPVNSFIVGTVSRLDPVKNQPMMLRAFKRFLTLNPDSWLLMVGDGPDRENLELLSRDLQIDHRVVFTGFKTNPTDYLALLDIFLLSSFTEGTSMTLLEAMSLGIPAVVTDVGGNPEILLNAQTGLLVPSDNEEEFAEAMLQIWRDPNKTKIMMQESKKRFALKFSVQKMAEQYQRIYEQLLR